ncbi:phosphoribosyl-ATP diphosphatase [Clostridium celatum]|uniref:phosphoribosyl-ATP diphosphatase n=1 Tax=Clostridium celatum TaxID=36834 RepID=UPI0011C790CF|nr:phosphoribosyl-ATP diphosphatase [Clostridium celatum]MCE9655936.1 phosphoribosyl-ATP diphosphatase [Clostridium celatum]MDU3723042.1 phosphoribosyl-ATP diphosphatase [Clostridium celatum]MDY3361069.1 phosphoribosyl-ATP diphosphatase [Clostridium celatum]
MSKVIFDDLYKVIKDREINGKDKSYTKYLLDTGTDKILKKVGEECTEVIIAAKENNKDEIVNEICDLAYHLLVLMVNKKIDIEDINNELVKRRDKINNFKGERKNIDIL